MINIAATIGEIYTGMGEYAQAQSGLREAALLFDTHGRDISSVYILVDLGQVYLEQDELDQAEQVLNNALEASQEMEMRNEQARCHLYLSDVFERRGRFDKALEYYKKFQALREGISGEGALKQLAALRVSNQIETAQRDAGIHRLQKEKLQIELDEHKRIHAILEDLSTRDPLTNLATWTAADGDTINLDMPDWVNQYDASGNAVSSTGLGNIIGGTGRFAGASGSYFGDISPPVINPGVPNDLTGEGTITY